MSRKLAYKPKYGVVWEHKKPKEEVVVYFEPKEGIHKCDAMFDENENRASEGDGAVSIYQDVETNEWMLRVGYEFLRVKFCPYCSEKL